MLRLLERVRKERALLFLNLIGDTVHLDVDRRAKHLIDDDRNGDQDCSADRIFRQLRSLFIVKESPECLHCFTPLNLYCYDFEYEAFVVA